MRRVDPLLVAIGLAVAALAAYLSVRLTAAIVRGDSLLDGAVGAMLLAAELFMSVHAFGYLASMTKARRHRLVDQPGSFAPHVSVPVAVLVTCYNESREVLEETLASVCAMDYPAFTVYLVDDSTDAASRRAAEALAACFDLVLVRRAHRAGFKAGAINEMLPRLSEPYLAVLDADQRPAASWLGEVVPVLERNPRLAFAQAPQVYVNTAGLPVAEAAAYQQAVFYEYICEGKSWSNAMFCCGSNVVIRRDALLSVEKVVNGRRHFLDETSVTEDFATSLLLHANGWQSTYVHRTYVVGMAPETLAAYFTQQTRWAAGTAGVFLKTIRRFLRQPGVLRPAQWFEYFLSGSYYFVGFANAAFMLSTMALLLGGISPVEMEADVYLVYFAPYFLFTFGVFLAGMRIRGFSLRGLWLGTALSFGSSWIYMTAATAALLGRKRVFGVTPKAVGGSIPLRALWPQATALMLCVASMAAGLWYLAVARLDLAYALTTAWAAYHALLLGTMVFYFNRRVTIPPRVPVFERARLAERT